MGYRWMRWIGISLIMLLNGCINPAPVSLTIPEAVIQRDEIQNTFERQMVILFQSLIQMDRRENLGLSIKQAKELLPMVVRNSQVGELELADQQLIIGQLTAGQKEFVNEFQERLRIKEQNMREFKKKDPSSIEEREAMIHEFEARRQLERDAEFGRKSPAQAAEEGTHGNPPHPPPASGGFGNGKNVEQQLIDLLQAKIRKEPTPER
ncbi:hypothetical protein SAMN03159341_110234 [Paenibacillus sp. 1_12]|uniref:hypothetical protein n=1 Tax=Paenibacillus sp. 1_12 TaxID=1566278 RepID=UPI0008EE84E4|nr:hypothetical protein [Paenibacillus sp. 1_12]SFL85051.1 hypothetical protein SAMN03159341_110234 [Paenibacillus sp. 1_12]